MLQTMRCKRCGREIATMSRPIYSTPEVMQKWQGICSRCITDKERFELMQDMNMGIQKKFQKI